MKSKKEAKLQRKLVKIRIKLKSLRRKKSRRDADRVAALEDQIIGSIINSMEKKMLDMLTLPDPWTKLIETEKFPCEMGETIETVCH